MVEPLRKWAPPADLELTGGVRLGEQRIPSVAYGAYVITVGDRIAQIGKGGGEKGHLAGRIRGLAKLDIHRSSRRVLCAAWCEAAWPLVWWRQTQPRAEQALEKELKRRLGDPAKTMAVTCHTARPLREALTAAASTDPWAAGYLEAVLEIGEKLHLLSAPRFAPLWREVGVPPGPWASWLITGEAIPGDRSDAERAD